MTGNSRFVRRLAGCVPVLISLVCGTTDLRAKPASFSHVYVFGDSYSDNGSALTVSEEAVKAKIPDAIMLPSAPESGLYWQGRWSNGPTAVELLARKIGAGLSDYAVGGARCGSGNYYSWLDGWRDTGLRGQVLGFLSRHEVLDPKALYVVGASANDLFQKIDFAKPVSIPDAASQCAADVRDTIALLQTSGARHFLVFGVYALDLVPAVAGTPAAVSQAREFEDSFDSKIQEMLSTMTKTSETTLAWFSWRRTTEELIQSGKASGLTNVEAPCQVTQPKPRKACNDPDAHLWWDEYHPTRHAHALIAARMADVLQHPD
ncbi:SGNH/GDSL hydrolase family protein [Acetobacter sp.]|jgi:phospholipase/lecithinase/hemolysin|uniref:SGNH/GDSL hydrolase family protein n=1 Tax=Acetobacter sp. TaxID=440 RepID=UPI0025C41AC1|nr:SGNH/GDSL hydrolase family protein [Acetobacter sp.]MCH4090496.1 SGNH/GDSL hydrolase family protein [Acetobacter sp.]MCI1299190.1 SGNH/GDSL hydrolase family protein [Acetobacter sp.]MCI1315737.1 SGNH/GDSL hydrolase family protein [Acetobacter sp.]